MYTQRHANFAGMGARFAAAIFSPLTAALYPRKIQFSARLAF